jgi:hypothetical protein
MPFQNQYPAELLAPAVKDAEERQLLSPAVCVWVEEAAGLRTWVFLRFVASLHWDEVEGKLHTRAEKGAQAQVQVQVPGPVLGRGEVRSRVLIG